MAILFLRLLQPFFFLRLKQDLLGCRFVSVFNTFQKLFYTIYKEEHKAFGK